MTSSPTFAPDPANPGHLAFTCIGCKGTACKRVRVVRPDGSLYLTEFVSCSGCGVMYHHKDPLRPGVGLPFDYMTLDVNRMSAEPPMSDDDLREIRDAAARANRSKKRR